MHEVGIEADVLHYPVVKPFRHLVLKESAKKTKKVVVVENHSVIGGLGSAVCESLCQYAPSKVYRIGTKDTFGQSGTPKDLLKYYKLDRYSIKELILRLIRKLVSRKLFYSL